MRVSDTTMVVSAIFHLAEKKGNAYVAPGEISTYLTKEFSLTVPLHAVSDVITNLGLVTHTVGSCRYIVWNDEKMKQLHDQIYTNFTNATTTGKKLPFEARDMNKEKNDHQPNPARH